MPNPILQHHSAPFSHKALLTIRPPTLTPSHRLYPRHLFRNMQLRRFQDPPSRRLPINSIILKRQNRLFAQRIRIRNPIRVLRESFWTRDLVRPPIADVGDAAGVLAPLSARREADAVEDPLKGRPQARDAGGDDARLLFEDAPQGEIDAVPENIPRRVVVFHDGGFDNGHDGREDAEAHEC